MKEEPELSGMEFAAVLMQHAHGAAHLKATEELAKAVEAVRDTGKNATVTVKLTLSPMKDNHRVVAFADRITSTIPEDRRVSAWFSDEKGGLHRNDPLQTSIFSIQSEQIEKPKMKGIPNDN